MSLIEINGQPNTDEHIQFVDDRIKLSKNMKRMLKSTAKLVPGGSDEVFCRINSSSQLGRGIYVFKQQAKYATRRERRLKSAFMPGFIKHMQKIEALFRNIHLEEDTYVIPPAIICSSDLSCTQSSSSRSRKRRASAISST